MRPLESDDLPTALLGLQTNFVAAPAGLAQRGRRQFEIIIIRIGPPAARNPRDGIHADRRSALVGPPAPPPPPPKFDLWMVAALGCLPLVVIFFCAAPWEARLPGAVFAGGIGIHCLVRRRKGRNFAGAALTGAWLAPAIFVVIFALNPLPPGGVILWLLFSAAPIGLIFGIIGAKQFEAIFVLASRVRRRMQDGKPSRACRFHPPATGRGNHAAGSAASLWPAADLWHPRNADRDHLGRGAHGRITGMRRLSLVVFHGDRVRRRSSRGAGDLVQGSASDQGIHVDRRVPAAVAIARRVVLL